MFFRYFSSCQITLCLLVYDLYFNVKRLYIVIVVTSEKSNIFTTPFSGQYKIHSNIEDDEPSHGLTVRNLFTKRLIMCLLNYIKIVEYIG